MVSDSADRIGITRTLQEPAGDDFGDARHDAHGLARGTILGRYVVLDRLGAGGMGVVYAAYDPELDRRVAVKVLRPERDAEASEGRARLVREAQAMARLSHPNVVAVHDVGTHEQRVFVAMEYIDGETLTQWLASAPRDWRAVVEVLVPVGRALEAVHLAGMVHRDLKPDNIMVGRDGRVRVMDLGLARTRDAPARPARRAELSPVASKEDPVSAEVTRRGVVACTPAYMAPEQHLEGGGDALSDQFSFGVTLYEALYHERPFAGDSLVELVDNVVEGRLRSPARHSDVPAWLREVVVRALAAAPAQRFADMGELVGELTRDRRRRGLRALAGAGAVAVGGLAVAAVWGADGARCEDAAAEIHAVWNEAQRQAATAAIVAGGKSFAADTAARVVARLDRYVDDWSAMRIETCESSAAAAERDESARLREACVQQRLAEFVALVGVLGEDSERLAERAMPAVLDLPDVRRCGDPAYLAARRQSFGDGASRRDISELRARLAEVRALERAGRYDDATAIANGLIDAGTELGERALLAEVRVRLGALHNFGGRYPDAERELIAAYADARWSRHDSAALEAAVQLVYVLGVNAGRFDDAMVWSTIAEAELGPTGERAEQRADLLSNIGSARMQQSDYPGALAAFEQALAIGTEVYGPEHLRVARYRANMVPVLAQSGQPDEAIALGLETLAMYEQALGPTHPNVALQLNNIGTSMYKAGRLEQAVEYSGRAYEIQRTALGEGHPDVAIAANNLGAMMHLGGRDDEAYAYYQQAREILRRTTAEDHIRMAGIEYNLGEVATRRGQLDDGLAHHQRALAIREKQLGPEHTDVAVSCIELAELLLALGRLDEATAQITRAQAIAEGKPELQGVRATGHGLRGLVERARGNDGQARHELEQAVTLLGADDEGESASRARLALAELLWREPSQRARARTLAESARRGFAAAGGHAEASRDAAARWLADHPEGAP